MNQSQLLIQKIETKQAVVGVIGLGYVGLPLLLRFAEAGFQAIGFDIDKSKVQQLNAGKSYIKHIPNSRVTESLAQNRFRATDQFNLVQEADALILCVPTPLDRHREPDLSYITDTMEALAPFLRKGQVLSLESTTYPGTTQEEIVPRIEKKGFKIGEDYFAVFSPEREDPGNPNFHTAIIPKIVGGTTESCLEVGAALYESVISKVVKVSSTQTAEMVKLLENIYRAVNIGLVNELKIVCDSMKIDIWEVIEAAATKPFGFTAFYPGPGLGGHCIPIDPFYLTWKAREFGVNSRFIELAGEVNSSMPAWVFNRIIDGLNDQGKALKGAKVILMGVAYKKNIDDVRESPALELIRLLNSKGSLVSYSDPHVPVLQTDHPVSLNMKSTPLSVEEVKLADCVILVTDHADFNYEMVQTNAKLIIDTRGRFRGNFKNVVKA